MSNKTSIIPIKLSENQALNDTYFSGIYNNRKWSGIYNWGSDNLMPDKLRELVYSSPTHAALVDLKVFMLNNYTIVDPSSELKLIEQFNPVPLSSLIRNIIRDYVVYSQFATQIIPTNSAYSLVDYTPIKSIRYSTDLNDKGDPYKVVISKDWSNTRIRENKRITLPLWERGWTGDVDVVYLFRDDVYDDIYQTPSYFSAIDNILTESSISRFNLYNIRNGWAPRLAITMHGTYSPEELAEIAYNLDHEYSGAKNAGRVVMMHAENPDNAPKIEQIAYNLNDNSYLNLVNTTKDYILSAHKCTSPALAGLSINGGFEGQGSAMLTAYRLYDQLAVNDMRQTIAREINKILTLAGYSIQVEFFLKDLQIESETQI